MSLAFRVIPQRRLQAIVVVGPPGEPGESAAADPIPANTAPGNFTGATAQPTPQTKSAWLTWLNAATVDDLNSLGSVVSSIGSSLTALSETVDTKVSEGDPRLTNARDWFASSVSQAEAEAGTEVIDRKWSALRVRQSTRVNPDFDPTGNLFTIGTSTNSQRLRLRRRFAGAGDFSQLSIDFSGDNCRIQTQHAGNNPNPLCLGTAGVDRLFLAADATRVGIGGSPTTRPLEIFAGTAGFRLQSSSVVSPPVYTELARTFDFLTWQDSTTPFNTFTDLVANTNIFNNHSVRLFVHTSGTSAPVLHSVFHASGRLSVGTDVDNGTDRLQVTGSINATGFVRLPGGSSSAASIRFSNWAEGIYTISNGFGFSIPNNTSVLAARYTTSGWGLGLTRDAFIGWGSQFDATSGHDLLIGRDASNTLAQRNGTNAQTARWYRTWANSTTNEFTELDCGTSSSFDIAACSGSVGSTNRGIRIGSKYAGASTLTPWLSFGTNGNATFAGDLSLSAGVISLSADRRIVCGNAGTAVQFVYTNSSAAAIIAGIITSAFQSLSADPSTIDIPSGSNRIVKNTTSGEVRDWVNDGGIMKKSPAYT